MVKRKINAPDTEPEKSNFKIPSEKEHLFQVINLIENVDNNQDIIIVKCEVIGGEEEGRSLLIRLSLDDSWKGFFVTRLFLKAINEPYKGNELLINTDDWQAKQFYATVKHNKNKDGSKIYANILEYNFEKTIEQKSIVKEIKSKEEIAWDE